jgi:hypothetical protein
MKIQNHESILMASVVKIEDGTVPHRIVLRKLEDSYMPYVTHGENLRIDGDVLVHDSFYWGHYHLDMESAVEDYKERSGEKD